MTERTFTKSGRSRTAWFHKVNAQGFFRTFDGTVYHEDRMTRTVRRAIPKVRGKAARKADKRARQQQRERDARIAAPRGHVLPPAASDVA